MFNANFALIIAFSDAKRVDSALSSAVCCPMVKAKDHVLSCVVLKELIACVRNVLNAPLAVCILVCKLVMIAGNQLICVSSILLMSTCCICVKNSCICVYVLMMLSTFVSMLCGSVFARPVVCDCVIYNLSN